MDDWFEQERLHTAAEDGDLATLKALVAEGRDLNATDSGLAMTPMHYAAAAEHIDVVRFLLPVERMLMQSTRQLQAIRHLGT